MTNRLITFRPSHYCEKARWALERAGVPYQEESHIPFLSWIATFGNGARRTVPALVTETATLPESTDILRWVDRQPGAEPLFPEGDEDTIELEEDFDAHLGPAARRVAYFHVLPQTERLKDMLRRSGPPWEARASKWLFPVIRAGIVRGLGVTAAGAERSRRVVDETFARMDERLADGRRFLTGDRFTAADLTFAALSYPVIFPDHTAEISSTYAELPPGLRQVAEGLRATPAGKFALRMWDEERRPA